LQQTAIAPTLVTVGNYGDLARAGCLRFDIRQFARDLQSDPDAQRQHGEH